MCVKLQLEQNMDDYYGEIPTLILECKNEELKKLGMAMFTCEGSSLKDKTNISRKIIQYNKEQEAKKIGKKDLTSYTHKFNEWFTKSGGIEVKYDSNKRNRKEFDG